MNLDKELIETVLRNEGYAHTVQRVVSMESESAVPEGENYMSNVFKIKLKVVLGNGRMAKKSLFLKVVPPEKTKNAFAQKFGLFKKEILMYTLVLREMEMLMEEYGDNNDPISCRIVHYKPYTSLLLEDLTASGFKLKKRQEGFDLDHGLLVMRTLGRYHGMTKVLQQRGIVETSGYSSNPLFSDPKSIRSLMYNYLMVVVKQIEDHWGPEWFEVAQKLKIPWDIFLDKILFIGKLDESHFNSLIHGDCWSNNMMFKYDWQNKPYTMRFIDYQGVNYNSVGQDLVVILHVSIRQDVRRAHFDTLLSTYHSSLVQTLTLYEYEREVPTLEWLHQELKRTAFAGFVVGCFKFVGCSDKPRVFDMDLFLRTEGAEGLDLEIFKDEYVRSLVDEDIKDLANIKVPEVINEYRSKIPQSAI